MPIRPLGSLLTFIANASSITTYVNEVSREFDIIDFDRQEFSNVRLRSAKNLLGGDPIIARNIANIPYQVSYVCANDDARPLIPDDANIANIKQRFNIQRYQIRSDLLPYGIGDQLESVYTAHRKLLDAFALYQEESSQMELSYDFLLSLQSQTFSYLTSPTPSLSMTGACIGGGTISNLLITAFSYSAEIEVKNADGTNSLLRSFTMVVENRQITTRA